MFRLSRTNSPIQNQEVINPLGILIRVSTSQIPDDSSSTRASLDAPKRSTSENQGTLAVIRRLSSAKTPHCTFKPPANNPAFFPPVLSHGSMVNASIVGKKLQK